jgi:membrane fusion protein, heavy metal efflux system
MSLTSHVDFRDFAFETALVVFVTISLVAGAALAVTGWLKRSPAAAHCVLFWALVWILVTPLAAIAHEWAGVAIVSIPPTRVIVSLFETTSEQSGNLPIDSPELADETVNVGRTGPPNTTLAKTSTVPSTIDAHVSLAAPIKPSLAGRANSTQVDDAPAGSDRRRATAAAILVVWLFGALVLFSRIIRSYVRMRAIRQALVPIAGRLSDDLMEETRRRLNVLALPEIAGSNQVCSPCVVGLLRPAIVLPLKSIADVSPKQLCDALVHECAHVVRRDCVVALLQRVAAALFWPNPLIHLFNRRLTNVRDEVCDNYVLADTDALSYSETLLHFARHGRCKQSIAMVGIFNWQGRLEKRIAALIDESRRTAIRASRASRIVALAAFGSVCLLACGNIVSSGQPSQQADRPKEEVANDLEVGSLHPSAVAVAKARLSGSSGSKTESVKLVRDQPHTLFVPEKVRIDLGIRNHKIDQFAVAKNPTRIPPLVLPGSTALDPSSIVSLRAFPSSRIGDTVLEIGRVVVSPRPGEITSREIRAGDRVAKGDLLAVLYSAAVGNTKSDLVSATSRLKINEEILKKTRAKHDELARPFLSHAQRDVRADQNAVDRAMLTLLGWGVSQKEIQAALDESRRVKDQGGQADVLMDSRWGRLEIRSPIDGVILERNARVHEVVDSETNLFQVANLDKLPVFANLPEKKLSALTALRADRRWRVAPKHGPVLSGFITDIGSVADPNQHTILVKGYVDNSQGLLHGGELVEATVSIPTAADVVEVPSECVIDDAQQSTVFVQKDPPKANYTMQRVDVVARFEKTALLQSKPLAKRNRLSAEETDLGLLPIEPILPGTRLVQSGVRELKTILEVREAEAGRRGT